MKKRAIGILVLCLMAVSAPAWAAAPLQTIQAHVNEVLAVLRDPALQAENAQLEKKAKLEEVADRMFDFQTLARITLGRNWKKLNSGQQQEFIRLYRQLLENAYMDKILAYTNEKILFQKETMLGTNKAEVYSTVVTSTARIPISYRMRRKGDTWRVYDVVIEGVSLVKNYRSQFKHILIKHSPSEMLKQLEEKVG